MTSGDEMLAAAKEAHVAITQARELAIALGNPEMREAMATVALANVKLTNRLTLFLEAVRRRVQGRDVAL